MTKVFVNQPWLLCLTITPKLWVGGKPMVANDVSMIREYFQNIRINKLLLENITSQMLLFRIFFSYCRTILIGFRPKTSIKKKIRFWPIVKLLFSISKLTTRGAGPIFFFINSEILVQHSVGIDTSFPQWATF